MTKFPEIDILLLILDEKSDPRLLGKIISLTGVFIWTEPHVEFSCFAACSLCSQWGENLPCLNFQKEEDLHMIVRDARGNELLEVINVPEEQAEDLYNPVNHCLAVVKVGNEYLMGWNHWRKNWEIFGGCKETGENMRQCIIRECREELGIENGKFTYLGLMHDKMAPGYFSSEWHYEYGGLYGITLPEDALADIEKNRTDKEEVEKLAFYSEIKGKEPIAAIDEKLLEYYTIFEYEKETCEGDRHGTV